MRSAVRRWATPITLLVLLALLGYGLWWGWEQLTRPFSDSTPCVTQSASVLITTQVTVQVFNGGSASGLAGQVTEQLAYHGFHTKSAANTSEQVGATTIVGAATDSPEVQLVAGSSWTRRPAATTAPTVPSMCCWVTATPDSTMTPPPRSMCPAVSSVSLVRPKRRLMGTPADHVFALGANDCLIAAPLGLLARATTTTARCWGR